MLTKIRNLIRLAKSTNIDSDQGNFPQGQVEYLGKTKDIVYVYPYGYSAKAPVGNTQLLWQVIGDETNVVGMEMSGPDRFKGTKETEVVVGNPISGSFVKFNADGSVTVLVNGTMTTTYQNGIFNGDIVFNGDTIFNGDVLIDGNLTVTGTITGTIITGTTITGDTLATTAGIDMDTHVHFDDGSPPVPGQTGPPVP